MTPDQARSAYRRHLKEPIAIRRFSGKAGPDRTATDTPCRGHVRAARPGTEVPAQLIGDVMEFYFAAIVLVEDLETAGFTLPLTTADKLVFRGREMAISFPDDATRSVDGELIAYNVRVKA